MIETTEQQDLREKFSAGAEVVNQLVPSFTEMSDIYKELRLPNLPVGLGLSNFDLGSVNKSDRCCNLADLMKRESIQSTRFISEGKPSGADDETSPEHSRKSGDTTIDVGDDEEKNVEVTIETIVTDVTRKRGEDGTTETFKSKDGFVFKKAPDQSIYIKDTNGVEYKVSPENELTVIQKDGSSKTYKAKEQLDRGGGAVYSYPKEAGFSLYRNGPRENTKVYVGDGGANQRQLETRTRDEGRNKPQHAVYTIISPKK